MKSYAMPLHDCHKWGTYFASHDWCEVSIGDWLIDHGYKINGLTARRVTRSYVAQLNRS